MQLVNLTPHPINLAGDGVNGKDVYVSIAPAGTVARVEMDIEEGSEEELEVNGLFHFASVRLIPGEIVGLPPVQEGVMYVVSNVVAQAAHAAARKDVLVPYDLVRDRHGTIVGCRGFSRP